MIDEPDAKPVSPVGIHVEGGTLLVHEGVSGAKDFYSERI
jgi:hypothetical protein